MFVFTDRQFADVERLVAEIRAESVKPQQRRYKVYNKARRLNVLLQTVRRRNDVTGKLF